MSSWLSLLLGVFALRATALTPGLTLYYSDWSYVSVTNVLPGTHLAPFPWRVHISKVNLPYNASNVYLCDPDNSTARAGTILFAHRGGPVGCSFGLKAKNAQNAGALALFIVDLNNPTTIPTPAIPEELNITIPVFTLMGSDYLTFQAELTAERMLGEVDYSPCPSQYSDFVLWPVGQLDQTVVRQCPFGDANGTVLRTCSQFERGWTAPEWNCTCEADEGWPAATSNTTITRQCLDRNAERIQTRTCEHTGMWGVGPYCSPSGLIPRVGPGLGPSPTVLAALGGGIAGFALLIFGACMFQRWQAKKNALAFERTHKENYSAVEMATDELDMQDGPPGLGHKDEEEEEEDEGEEFEEEMTGEENSEVEHPLEDGRTRQGVESI